MESYLLEDLYDLVTPDGVVTEISSLEVRKAVATVRVEGISPAFIGFQLDPNFLIFNIKSTLAQLGVEGIATEISLDHNKRVAEVSVALQAIDSLGADMLGYLEVGTKIGKLFAADPRRRVRDPDYLFRMFGRSDQKGRPLLSLGGMRGSDELAFETVEGRAVAYLTLRDGVVSYDPTIHGFLPTINKALQEGIPVRELLHLHQIWNEWVPRRAEPGKLLLVKTAPLHVRTVFAKVIDELLPQGCIHTSANVLQPDTMASGDIYEIYGQSMHEVSDIPLEFYTLEPHREHVFFKDRDQLQAALESPKAIAETFETAPPEPDQAAVYVCKGTQLHSLKPEDWITRDSAMQEFPGFFHGVRQALMVERYMQKQAAYPFLNNIESGLITSQGVLFTRYLPSPVLKRMLIASLRSLKGIYFQKPSLRHGEFFSYEDRAMLIDLAKFAIPIYWVDERTEKVLQFVQRPGRDTGMFVPLDRVSEFYRATFFGLYGSNLLEGNFEDELTSLLKGILKMRNEFNHTLLNPETPLAFVTGGGPGAMEVGSRVAQELGILSCANIVDFTPKGGGVVNEQLQNPYVDARMTYRLEKLVERQAEFYLDFPIFLQGGIGTDFEFALEEVGRKIGATPSYPVLLFGEADYWREKISHRFKLNRKTGTIVGSEWVSNAFYCVGSAEEGLSVYRKFLSGELSIGKEGPVYDDGFCDVSKIQT